MNITFLVENTGCCGGNRTILMLANELLKLGHNVRIIANRFIPWLTVPVKIEEVPYIPAKIKTISPEEIIIATFWTTAYTAKRLKNQNIFYLCQHYETIFNEKAEDTYDFPFKFITTSNWLRNKILKLHGKDSKVIVPGVDRSIFYPRNKKRKYKLLTLSTPFPWKGLEEITIPAYNIVKEKYDVELHTFGTPIFSQLINHGQISDVELAQLYSSSNIYICGSTYESPGLPILEAMSCGTHVISTAIGSEEYTNEIIPRNPMTVASRIESILKEECTVNQANIERAKSFTWAKAGLELEKYIEESI